MSTTNVVDTDYLAVMRADLVELLAGMGFPTHDTEPNSLGESPAAWFGRPTLTYDQFDKHVMAEWPLTVAGHTPDPEQATHTFDTTIWVLWRGLGLGRRAMVDGQRSVTAIEARPGTDTIGDTDYPTYHLIVQTTVFAGIC